MMSGQEDPPAKSADMLFVHSPTEAGDGFKVVRMREDSIEVGEIRGAPEGRPIHGDLVKLTPRPEHKQLFDVDVLVSAPKRLPEATQAEPQAQARAETKAGPHAAAMERHVMPRSGPPQVATEAYRENWMAIFGGHRAKGEEPN